METIIKIGTYLVNMVPTVTSTKVPYGKYIYITGKLPYTVTQWFSTWGTRVFCDTLTLKIVTLRLYFYVTLLIQKYKENDT